MAKTTSVNLMDYLAQAGVHLPEETVYIEAWDREVTLRGMSSKLRDAFEEDSLKRANMKAGNGAASGRRGAPIVADLANFRSRLVSRHIIEDGVFTFANKKGEDILGEQPASVLDRLFTVCQRLSGFTSEDIEALTKNSLETDENDSSISSPEPSDEPMPN